MKLSQLKNFLAVAERGSVQGSARQSGVTQPAVTRSVHDLERALGATFFQLSGTGMTLTSIGNAVLRRAEG
jgi:LysR family transcriptional regulator of abg operon